MMFHMIQPLPARGEKNIPGLVAVGCWQLFCEICHKEAAAPTNACATFILKVNVLGFHFSQFHCCLESW